LGTKHKVSLLFGCQHSALEFLGGSKYLKKSTSLLVNLRKKDDLENSFLYFSV
jgi:hypothetical protein